MTNPLKNITREHVGVVFMVVGFGAAVGGIAVLSLPWAAIIGGGLLLAAGIAVDRMS